MFTRSTLLMFVIFSMLSCQRDNMETQIVVKVFYKENKKPVFNAPVMIVSEYREKGSSSYATRSETYYTDVNGQVSFKYEMSEKSDYEYFIRTLQGDSNANSHRDVYLSPGIPNFYTEYVNRIQTFPVLIRHASGSASDNDIYFSALLSEYPGSRLYARKFELPKGKDTLLYIPALNDHVMTMTLSYKVTVAQSFYRYSTVKKMLVDANTAQTIPEFLY